MKRPGRAGRHVRQPNGYRAFIPEPLPPRPGIQFDEELQTLLSKADRALGRLDGSIQTLPDPDLFVFMYVRKEAVLSSQIEGTQASLHDVLNAEAKILDPSRPGDVNEVLNYIEAMNYGMDRLKSLPVSIRLIREIHERLVAGVRGQFQQPGEIRTSQNWIGPQGCTLADATFVPPSPGTVMECLGALEKFLHADVSMPVLIKIGLAHAQFETIHPFLDGNGRIGRLLITFLLCEKDILQTPLLYLSVFFKRHRMAYYDLLQNTRDNGDFESWLKFFLRGLAETSNAATATARLIVALREEHRNVILEHLGRRSGNAIALLETLFRSPTININGAARQLGISYANANHLVAELVSLGILREVTGQARNRVFYYRPYIDLFDDI